MDGGVEAFVLAELADDAGRVAAGIINAQKVCGADSVSDGAEIGIARDAARKLLAAVFADMDFAKKLDLDLETVSVPSVQSFSPVVIE